MGTQVEVPDGKSVCPDRPRRKVGMCRLSCVRQTFRAFMSRLSSTLQALRGGGGLVLPGSTYLHWLVCWCEWQCHRLHFHFDHSAFQMQLPLYPEPDQICPDTPRPTGFWSWCHVTKHLGTTPLKMITVERESATSIWNVGKSLSYIGFFWGVRRSKVMLEAHW